MPIDHSYTDEQLLQALSLGDRVAYERIYQKYWWPLLDTAWKRLKDKQQAEDLLQDVFCRLWAKRKQLQIGNLEAYLKTAVRYEILNYFTRTKKDHIFFEPFQEILRENNTPEEQFAAKHLLELIFAYANTLPEKRKEILLLHLKSRFSTKEIADLLHISQKTVQNQLGTALNGLRTHIIPFISWLIATRL